MAPEDVSAKVNDDSCVVLSSSGSKYGIGSCDSGTALGNSLSI